MKITNTNEAKLDGVKMIVYGKSGAGKTTMLASAPNPIIISSESGLLALKDKDIPVLEVSTEEDLSKAYKYVADSDYETICLDSISDIAESVLADYKNKFTDGRMCYGKLGDTISKYIRRFRDLKGKHVILIAKEANSEVNNVAVSQPSMPGQTLTVNLPYFVDLVLRLEVKKDKRILHTASSFTQVCKDRSGMLDKTEEANLASIIKKICQ